MTDPFVDLKERIALNEDFSPAERTLILTALNTVMEAFAAEAAAKQVAQPPNYLGRIERIWAFLSVDDGGEGVCAAPMGNMTLPLIAADKRRLDQLIPAAKRIATLFNKPVRLAKFTKREDVTIFQP